MGRTTTTMALTLALLVAVVAWPAAGHAGSNGAFETFTVHTRAQQAELVPTEPPTGGPPAAGDRLVVHNELLADDEVVGQHHVVCTFAHAGQMDCTGHYVVDGRGAVVGKALVALGEPSFEVAVVGGTGDFTGASGVIEITVIGHTPRVEELTFRLSKGRPAAARP